MNSQTLTSAAWASHPTAQPVHPATINARSSERLKLCHFTVAHKSLKSRSFHRLCLPCDAAGFNVTYVSPAQGLSEPGGVRFLALPLESVLLPNAFAQFRLLRVLLKQEADIYHFQDPQLLALALTLKLIFRKRVAYDAYEDFPSMAQNKPWRKPAIRLAKRAIEIAESIAARSFDAIVTADPLTMRRFARVGKSRKLVFYNFPNLDFFPSPVSTEKRFHVVYRGGLSERTGTFVLLDALHRLALSGRKTKALLLGYSDSAVAERKLRDGITALGLSDSVEVRGRIPHEEMAVALSQARIGISPLQDVPKFRLNIPVKIFEYWACGLPVIASNLPPIRPFLAHSDAAVSFPASDAEALAKSIAQLLDHPDEAHTMGQRGRQLVERRFNNAAEIRKWFSLCAAISPARTAPFREAQNA